MGDGKTKEQLLAELIQMHRDIEKKMEAQDRFIGRFQLLIQNEGLFSQVIGSLPFPVAIFERSGIVRMANNLLMAEANMKAHDLSQGKINLLDRVTDENYGVFEAAEDVFAGETMVVKNLADPLVLFCMAADGRKKDPYHTAVFFPVPDGDGIRYGAVMLMQ